MRGVALSMGGEFGRRGGCRGRKRIEEALGRVGREEGEEVIGKGTGGWAGVRLGMLECQGQVVVLYSEGLEGPWKGSEPLRGRSHGRV